jgi:HK97 family phage major capsid protein
VVADLIPQDDTDAAFIIYMEETGFSNQAAAVAEGAVKPESADAFTRRTVPMTKIATTLPITDEQASDVPQIEAILRNRLGFMVQLEEERELLIGNPGGSNAAEMTGILNKAGVLTQAKGSLDTFTATLTAITRVQSVTGFADPSAFIFHPTDWLNIRTIKDTQGRFIMGNPDMQGPEVLWGLPVVRTIAEPLGTILTGDFRTYAHIDRRWGLRVDVGYVNDDFTKNQAHLRAEERLALEIYRASAFCQVTGV